VWEFVLDEELGVSGGRDMSPVHLVKSLPQSLGDMTRSAELMFERFNAPSISIFSSPSTSLMASGLLIEAYMRGYDFLLFVFY